MNDFTMTIGGAAVRGESFFSVTNPATGAHFADAPECTIPQLEQAMEAAQGAFASWRQDERKRRQALVESARILRADVDGLADILTREQGKPLSNARDEIKWAADFLEVVTGTSIAVQTLRDDAKERIEVRRKPFGVVVGIVPWNFPVLIACWKIGQSLVMGNTIVLKPSPFTPLATLRMGELLRKVLPPGVLNVVSGGNELGAAMTSHAVARKISFTGSVATGKRIAQAAATDLKHVTLELGGNDPAIVLKDVNPAVIAEKMFWSAFVNCGQSCIAIKRVYVHESIYPGLVAALAEIARHVKVGDGLLPDTQMGPLNNRMQFERVASLVDDAKRSGGRFATGGNPRPGTGYFFEPTIVTDVGEGTRLVDEEQFGPALPVMPYRDVEDALEQANATHYGLGGSIWTNDHSFGAELASRLECGTGWVNQHAVLDPSVPFGGAKWSGLGHEFGSLGMESYSQAQIVRLAK
jgi:acyl-CoA reductase-like NAD-dependent aldehyde dehydrogenase